MGGGRNSLWDFISTLGVEMSLGEYIKFCKCKGRILTTEQMRKGLPCEECQKEKVKDAKEDELS